MENEMLNEVIVNEAAQDITTQVAAPSGNNGLKNVAIVGGIMTLGALAWEFGVKPIGRKVKNAFKKAKDEREEEPAENEDELDIDDPEKDYPIK